MDPLIRRISRDGLHDTRLSIEQEWLVTNSMGGYASGTLPGVPTRRYHGYLIAALPSPLGRVVMLNHISERLRLFAGDTRNFESETTLFGGELMSGDSSQGQMGDFLTEFRLENGLPYWHYRVRGFAIEKTLMMPHGQNSVFITYRLIEGPREVQLELRPGFHFRPHEAPVSREDGRHYSLSVTTGQFQIVGSEELPILRMGIEADRHYTVLDDSVRQVYYPAEAERGYEATGKLWSPGFFCMILKPGQSATLIASTEEWRQVQAIRPVEAWDAEQTRRSQLIAMADESLQSGLGAELLLGADQFIITPVGRAEDAIRARASGDDVRTVIAGYHWFTDWGRDTMISLEGLALMTGRKTEARSILRTFGHYIQNGLIPNRFPEHTTEAVYNTADATLWYFHAMDRYLEATGDRVTLRLLLPRFIEVIEAHLAGTIFGIGADPNDGLLRQGQEGYQLTWMDAKVGDWVVTPRRGKAVEINALWYNALCLLAQWLREENLPGPSVRYAELADRVCESFNKRFWYEEGQYLYDCVDGPDGDDAAIRPNQVFAISLPRAVLDRRHWEPVMKVVTEKLLTPVGLRSLAPGHADYRPRYSGDLWSRDASYHQGTVWAWLIGPYIDAWLKIHADDRPSARRFLQGFESHLNDACIGSISEVYDAEEPFTPRGCIAQAWSIAEVLRCWVKTAR